jgi:hypothetical protein
MHFEFFDLARQFRHAYETLPNSGHPPEWPKYLLFYHAMELALKAYLIARGVSEQDLKNRPFGHNIKKLVDEAVDRGLTLPPGSRDMIADLGGQPPGPPGLDTVAAHLRIRYPGGGQVFSLGQFEPYMQHLFTAVARHRFLKYNRNVRGCGMKRRGPEKRPRQQRGGASCRRPLPH